MPCRPQRPDAVVIVGAQHDAYVSPQSVLELQQHLTGSEVRCGQRLALALHEAAAAVHAGRRRPPVGCSRPPSTAISAPTVPILLCPYRLYRAAGGCPAAM